MTLFAPVMTGANLIRVMPAEGRGVQATQTEPATIAIMLNGQDRRIAQGSDVGALLALLGLDTAKVAVERNEAILPRSLYGQTRLATGDRLEIVHFIGGG